MRFVNHLPNPLTLFVLVSLLGGSPLAVESTVCAQEFGLEIFNTEDDPGTYRALGIDSELKTNEPLESDEELETSSESTNESELQRFDVVLTLDATQIKQLRATGILKAAVPTPFRDRVDSVVLKLPNSFLDERFTPTTDADKKDQQLTLEIDESVISHLGYQPVRLKFFHSNFDTIALKYQPVRIMIPDQGSKFDPVTDSPDVVLTLKTGQQIAGNVKNHQALTIKSEFAEIPIPYQVFAGVQFNIDDENRAVIVFQNGDNLSGIVDAESILLRTRWGDKTFQIDEIESLTRNATLNLLAPSEANNSTQSNWSYITKE